MFSRLPSSLDDRRIVNGMFQQVFDQFMRCFSLKVFRFGPVPLAEPREDSMISEASPSLT
jgi:hypothetical protein